MTLTHAAKGIFARMLVHLPSSVAAVQDGKETVAKVISFKTKRVGQTY